MSAHAQSVLLDITANALEAVSLSHVPLPITPPPYPPPPTTTLSSLPTNIPLPVPPTPNAHHVQQTLRALTIALHTALPSPHTHLPHILNALLPVVLASAQLAHHLAHLNVVPLLLSASSIPPYTLPALLVLRPLLSDPLARSRFAAAHGPDALLLLLHSAVLSPTPSPLVPPICAALADAIPHLPPPSVHALRTSASFQLFQRLLHHHVLHARPHVCRHLLRLLAALVPPNPQQIQPFLREHRLLPTALNAINHMPHLVIPAFSFLQPAIANDITAIAQLGSLHSAQALDLVLKACRSPPHPTQHLVLLIDTLTTLAQHPRNFHRMLLLGLTPTLVHLLPTLPPKAQPPATTLLATCLTSTTPATATHVGAASDVILHNLTVCTAHPLIQVSGLSALTLILESVSAPIPSTVPARAVQAAHFAMTEHSSNPRVLQACARLFLVLPPAEIVASVCPLPDLSILLRARLHTHCADDAAADALADAVQALDFVVAHTRTTRIASMSVCPPTHPIRPYPRARSLVLRPSSSSGFRKSLRRKGNRNRLTPSANSISIDPNYHYDYPIVPETYVGRGISDVGVEPPKTSNLWRKQRAKRSSADDTDKIFGRLRRQGNGRKSVPWIRGEGTRGTTPVAAVIMTEPLKKALQRSKEAAIGEHSSANLSIRSLSQRASFGSRESAEISPTPVPWVEATLRKVPRRTHSDGVDKDQDDGELENSEAERRRLNGKRREQAYSFASEYDAAVPSSAAVVERQRNGNSPSPPRRDDRMPSFNAILNTLRQGEGDSWDDRSSEESEVVSQCDAANMNGAWASVDEFDVACALSSEQDELYDSHIGPSLGEDEGNAGEEGEGVERSQGLDIFGRAVNGAAHVVEEQAVNEYDSRRRTSLSSDGDSDKPLSPRMDGDPVETDVLVGSSRRFGERERRYGGERGSSGGGWSRPNWSMWPNEKTSLELGDSKSFPNGSFQPRVESGTLRLRR